jgi:hypothetical protein
MQKEFGAADKIHIQNPKLSPHAAAILRYEQYHARQEDKEKRVRRSGRVKKMAATLAAVAAFGGMAAPSAQAKKAPRQTVSAAHVSKAKAETKASRSNLEMKSEILQKIKTSTLEIGRRMRADKGGDPNAPYQAWCTAVKVQVEGQEESSMMLSAHCVTDATGVRSGAFTNINAPQDKAENYTDVGLMEYAVLDPSIADVNTRLGLPIAIVDRFSVSTDTKDTALMHAVPVRYEAGASIARPYDSIPAIPLKVAEEAPPPGTPVALYGEPQSNGFEPRADVGTYLGRVTYTEYAPGSTTEIITRQLDMVGINPSGPKTDNCMPGTSGSMGMLPDGRLLGNLSIRTSDGYGSKHLMLGVLDPPDFDNHWRPIWQEELNEDLGKYPVLCGFSVFSENTPQDLINGLNVLPPGASQDFGEK